MDIGISMALGTITGCFGGVVEDVFLCSRSLIFRKEIYATALIIVLFRSLTQLWATLIQDTGYRMQDAGCRMQDAGCWSLIPFFTNSITQ